ncbi:MAG TPA: DNA internalization-related competence protein ComEC/Rec2, partial [Thauera phenylacetica]|nr:DNA internalization-related competence protein ComEC/Rec2 [Thauera phenylacetica]
MRTIALGFLAGTLLVQSVDSLDGLAVAGWLGVALAVGLRAALARVSDADEAVPRWLGIALTTLAALAAGVGWAAWRAEVRLGDELAGTLEGVELSLRGRVAGL